MISPLVESIANAVLYEGYILYPYRSALKNRQRWTFGGLYPRTYSEAQRGSDAWSMQTESLLVGSDNASVHVQVRFLHLIHRIAAELTAPLTGWPEDREPDFRPVSVLRAGPRQYPSWQEAAPRDVFVTGVDLAWLTRHTLSQPFRFPASRSLEPISSDGQFVGALVREQQSISGVVELHAEPLDARAFKLTLRIRNETELPESASRAASRDDALLRSLVSTHAVLSVRDGSFLSSIDPPPEYEQAARTCRNVGSWPVLAGEDGQTDTMLAAPIILYDYPQVAPESPGDLFDGAEIDEILTLRIMTLTDEEKAEVASVDPRAGELLARTEGLGPEQLMSLHGTIRRLRPMSKENGNV